MGKYDEILSPLYDDLVNLLETSTLSFTTSFDYVARARELLNRNTDIRDYSLFIKTDPLLLLKTLKLVNKNSKKPTSNAFRATQMLGRRALRAMIEYLAENRAEEHTYILKEDNSGILNNIWMNTIDSSILSYCIANKLKICDPDEARLAAIVYNLGQLFLLSIVDRYPAICINQECICELIHTAHIAVTQHILDVLNAPSNVIECYSEARTEFTDRPHWPLNDITDILVYSLLMSDYKNNYLQSIINNRKSEFIINLTNRELVESDNLLESIYKDRVELLSNIMKRNTADV